MQTKYIWTQVDSQGRVVIPAEVRKLKMLEPGDRVAFVLDEEGVSFITVDEGVLRSQALAKKYIKREPGRSIVDEFIADRRAEAARE